MLNLNPPFSDIDQVFSSLKSLGDNDIKDQARPFIWRDENRLANDPEKDWINKYGTVAAHDEFKFDTDLSRDLIGLWARVGDERLYIRVDYSSPIDLEGLVFQDTLLLFDYDSPNSGYRKISESTEWDRGAERQVLLRHWFDRAEKSQYDVEIRDDKGNVLSRFLTSDFPIQIIRISIWRIKSPALPDQSCSLYRKKCSISKIRKRFIFRYAHLRRDRNPQTVRNSAHRYKRRCSGLRCRRHIRRGKQ